MEGGESVLDNLFEEESIEDAEDVEMIDTEEGELIEQISKAQLGESSDVGVNKLTEESKKRNSRHRKKKKKNKRKGPNVNNVNRFVSDVCKRLKERKSYLVWSAVGCLGISAFSDLVKEVDAIQARGGQKTADGSRFRNGGGILWNIIKIRDPNAYREIMRKGKEFEKQFKQQVHGNQGPAQLLSGPPKSIVREASQDQNNSSDALELLSRSQSQLEQSNGGQKRASVHDRMRIPVTYDDLLGGDLAKDESG